jgi:hypothetical protein
VGEEDEGLLTHLSDLWVEETDNSFKIIFVRRFSYRVLTNSLSSMQKFSKEASAWLDGDTLWKEFKGEPGGSVSVSSSPLKWKAGKVRIQYRVCAVWGRLTLSLSPSETYPWLRTSLRRLRSRRTV